MKVTLLIMNKLSFLVTTLNALSVFKSIKEHEFLYLHSFGLHIHQNIFNLRENLQLKKGAKIQI